MSRTSASICCATALMQYCLNRSRRRITAAGIRIVRTAKFVTRRLLSYHINTFDEMYTGCFTPWANQIVRILQSPLYTKRGKGRSVSPFRVLRINDCISSLQDFPDSYLITLRGRKTAITRGHVYLNPHGYNVEKRYIHPAVS
jgi:hypothetical protein